MHTDTKVKAQTVIAIHLGDVIHSIGPLTYTAEEINRAVEKDGTLGASQTAHKKTSTELV